MGNGIAIGWQNNTVRSDAIMEMEDSPNVEPDRVIRRMIVDALTPDAALTAAGVAKGDRLDTDHAVYCVRRPVRPLRVGRTYEIQFEYVGLIGSTSKLERGDEGSRFRQPHADLDGEFLRLRRRKPSQPAVVAEQRRCNVGRTGPPCPAAQHDGEQLLIAESASAT